MQTIQTVVQWVLFTPHNQWMCCNLLQEVKPALPDLTQRTQMLQDGNLKMNKSQKYFGWADSLLEIINILSYFLQTMTNWIFVFNNMVDLDTANVQISVNSSHHGRNDATSFSSQQDQWVWTSRQVLSHRLSTFPVFSAWLGLWSMWSAMRIKFEDSSGRVYNITHWVLPAAVGEWDANQV